MEKYMTTTKGGTPAKSTNRAMETAEETGTALVDATANDVFAAFANAGFENVKTSDILVPRITILQDMSPQIKLEKPEFIEGAKRGMVCDVGTGQLMGDGFLFVPVHYMKVWLEWFPRKSGKGLATIHTDPTIIDQCVLNEKRQPFLENGNYISETAQLFGLDVTDGGCRQVFIPFSSTQLKKSKRLLTLALAERIMTSRGEITPPLFYRSYIMSTVAESNSEGDWFGWKIERGMTITELLNSQRIMEAAIKMRKQIDDGAIKADMSADEAMDNASASHYEGAM
jgi:hypothetical protein